MSLLLFPVLKLSRENTQPENMCDSIFENTKYIYAKATVQVSIVSVTKGELASEIVNYDIKTMYQFERKCNLLGSTLQVKQQVSETVVRRFLKIS